jgi:hypothetical protein
LLCFRSLGQKFVTRRINEFHSRQQSNNNEFAERRNNQLWTDPISIRWAAFMLNLAPPSGSGRRTRQTKETHRVPTVNNHGGFGCWAFLEVGDVHRAEAMIRAFLARRITKQAAEWVTAMRADRMRRAASWREETCPPTARP